MFYNAQSEINQVPNSELQINNFFTQDSQLNLPLKNVKHHRHAGQQKRKKKKKRENKSNKDQQFSYISKKKSPKGRINTHFNAL